MSLLCHTLFAAAVLAMMTAVFFGLSRSLGTVPGLWAVVANAALIVRFPLVHSLLLTRRGGRLTRLISGPHGMTLAIITSAQLLALFAFRTSSGLV
jgi:hypothetical protein